MKLLAFRLKNTAIFSENTFISLTNKDTARRLASDRDDEVRLFPIAKLPAVYTPAMFAFVGINATGKTTLLQVCLAMLRILNGQVHLNDPAVQPVLRKLLPLVEAGSQKNTMVWDILFETENCIYELSSVIGIKKNNDGEDVYCYEEETLKQKKKNSVKKSDIYDFSEIPVWKKRSDLAKDALFLGYGQSIADSITKQEEPKGIFSVLDATNLNVPRWAGITPHELISCFDSSVEQLNINPNTAEDELCSASFKRNPGVVYKGDIQFVMSTLSSGTIKGLGIMPGLIRALTTGGYVIIDEIENHLNRKLVEWIFSLFESTRTNPLGAMLLFSTHYPELLDSFVRKDTIYITRRKADYLMEVLRYCEEVKRGDISKSNILLCNIIRGTSPAAADLKAGTAWIEQVVQHLLGKENANDK